MVKKAQKKRRSPKKVQALEPKIPVPARKETEIGRVTHFFDKINVAVIELSGKLKVGDSVRIRGNVTDFTQKVGSIQIEHESKREAKKGDAIGLKVSDDVREHDRVFLVA